MMNLNYATTMRELRLSVFADEELQYKVLETSYENTGGHCMVGISTVWLPQLNQTLYAVVNDECAAIYTVDHIRQDLDINDYDDVTLDLMYWSAHEYTSRYYDLYRDCRFEYLKSDCKACGRNVFLDYDELTEDMKGTFSTDMFEYMANNGLQYETDGYKALTPRCIEKADQALEPAAQDMQHFISLVEMEYAKVDYDNEADTQRFYDMDVTISFGPHTFKGHNCSAIYEALQACAETFIENY